MLRLGEIRPLRDVLAEFGNLVDADGYDVTQHVEGWLFLPRQPSWTLESPAVLLKLSEDEEDDEEAEMPELAKKEGLKLDLLGAHVQDIICNARQQKRDVSLDEIFGAFLYYCDFDAFKDFATHA